MKRRVVIIGHTYTVAVNRLKLEQMSRDDRFEFLLVTPRRWRNQITSVDNQEDAAPSGYHIEFVDVWLGRHPATYLIQGLRDILANFHPDLIYCEQEPICLVSLQTALARGDVPIVYYSWENIARRDVRYRVMAPIRRACLARAAAMVAGSRETADVIRELGFRRPIYVTPLLGVSLDLFYPDSRARRSSNLPPGRFVIGSIGRLVPEKNVLGLLRAASTLREIDWHVIIVGDGPQRGECEAAVAAMGLADRVTMGYAVTHENVPALLNSCDVVVLPSLTTPRWKEQFGHVLVEAMACGVPVIGSSSGAIPDTIGDAGLIYDEDRETQLASQLRRLAQDPTLRRALGDRGVCRVREHFSDALIAQNTVAIIEAALGMPSSYPSIAERLMA